MEDLIYRDRAGATYKIVEPSSIGSHGIEFIILKRHNGDLVAVDKEHFNDVFEVYDPFDVVAAEKSNFSEARDTKFVGGGVPLNQD